MNELSEVELGHWDDDRTYRELLEAIAETVREHFADYFFHAEEGAAAARARKQWVESLSQAAEALSDASWQLAWVDGWTEVLRSAEGAYETELVEWRTRVAKALADRADFLRLVESEHVSPDLVEAVIRSFDATINSEPPREPVISGERAAAVGAARRGLVATQMMEIFGEARDRASRMLDLLDLLRYSQHSENLRLYLGRCGRAYIGGAYPEACVMCAAAIELRLSEIIDASDAVSRLKLKGETQLTMGKKLEYAKDVRLIPASMASEVFWLVRQRNSVMHFTVGVADAREDALRALHIMMEALSHLQGIPSH